MGYRFRRTILPSALAFVLCGCATVSGGTGGGPLHALLVAQTSGPASAAAAENERLLEFYEARNYRHAWVGSADAEASAHAARAVLARAGEHGLRAEDYAVPPAAVSAGGGIELQQYDIALTRAVLRYAMDLRTGRHRPGEIYGDAELPAPGFDAAAELDNALARRSVAEFLAGLAPPHPEYRALLAALARYRALDAGGTPFPATGRIALDNATPEREILIRLLSLEDGDLAALAEPPPAEIRAAVRRFQTRNRLAADGIVGPNTLEALHAQSAARTERIKANLERWRWLPHRLEARYITVNVPEQSLEFVQDGEIALRSAVIVGNRSSATPILRTTIASVKANPPWNIPGDIAARDLLPYMRRNPNYLAERNMVLVDTLETDPHGKLIDWSEVEPNEFYYRVRQLPGPDTALGDLMLDMPNDFDVYLHDTPAKNLFALDDRAVSNGCVRVQEIFPLASLALTGDAEAGMERIRAAIATRETQLLALESPLPVYLLYWTAVPGEHGSVRFPPDRYGRDAQLMRALNAPRGEPLPEQTLAARAQSGPETAS